VPASCPDPTHPAETRRGLAEHFAALGLIPASAAWTPLSGGRTNRLWHVAAPFRDLTVKLFSRGDDNPLFGNDPLAEERLLTHLSDTGLAPRLVHAGKTPLGHCLVYSHVPGAIWSGDPRPVAATLRRLHAVQPPPGLHPAPDGSAALAQQTLRILALCPAPQAQHLRGLRPGQRAVPASGTLCLLHGDCVPGNLILGPDGLTLIDWQCPAVGDPTEDIATFLSPAMQSVYRDATLSPDEIHAFLTGLDAPHLVARYRALAPWYHWRMAAYCLWKSLRGDADYATALALELACLPS
jgi:hypothetical protein